MATPINTAIDRRTAAERFLPEQSFIPPKTGELRSNIGKGLCRVETEQYIPGSQLTRRV